MAAVLDDAGHRDHEFGVWDKALAGADSRRSI